VSVYFTTSFSVCSRRRTKTPIIYPGLRLDYKVATHPDNALLAVDLINRIYNYQVVRRCFGGALHIYRTKFLWKNACQELVEIHNYGLGPAPVELLLGVCS
jgi:hypothetical protein